MKDLIRQQINKIKKITDYNSDECIKEINELNILICESELPLNTIKHLPSQLDILLNQLLKELEKQK